MSDFNVMIREQARTGLQTQLDAAVTNGDTDAARKATEALEKLAVATAPKPPAFNNDDIKAELDKQPWFGIDPRKSAKVVELGKTMDPKKFATAAAFAEALVKAVDEEFKPASKAKEPAENETDEEREARELEEQEAEEAAAAAKAPKRKATDGPTDDDTGGARQRRQSAGPWTKLSDAPDTVRKEINRAADKMVSSSAPKEQRDKFITKALESHYAIHQRTRGKK